MPMVVALVMLSGCSRDPQCTASSMQATSEDGTQELVAVPLAELIVHRERYYGRAVRVHGYLFVDTTSSLFATRSDRDDHLFLNSVELFSAQIGPDQFLLDNRPRSRGVLGTGPVWLTATVDPRPTEEPLLREVREITPDPDPLDAAGSEDGGVPSDRGIQ